MDGLRPCSKFRDFSDTEERIEKGLRAYDTAERVGWARVFDSMEYYGQMPSSFFGAPDEHFEKMKTEVIRKGHIASEMSEGDGTKEEP